MTFAALINLLPVGLDRAGSQTANVLIYSISFSSPMIKYDRQPYAVSSLRASLSTVCSRARCCHPIVIIVCILSAFIGNRASSSIRTFERANINLKFKAAFYYTRSMPSVRAHLLRPTWLPPAFGRSTHSIIIIVIFSSSLSPGSGFVAEIASLWKNNHHQTQPVCLRAHS